MSLNQIKGGAILSYVSMILGNIIVLLYTPFMLRSLGSSEYGIYSICNTVGSSIAMLDAGFGIAAVKYIVRDKSNKERLPYTLGTLMLVNFCLGVVAFVLAGSFSAVSDTFYGESMTLQELHSLKIILWLTSIYLTITFMVSVFPAVVVAYERFIFIKVVDICKSFLLPLIIVPFLLCGYKAIAMSLITLLVFTGVNIVKIIYAFTHLKIKISFKRIDTDLLKQALPFAGLIVLKLILERVYWSGGQLVLGAVSGTLAVAIFALALQISGYYNFVAQAVNNMFLPRCTELYEKNDIKGLSDLFLKVSRIQTMILGVILCVFCVFGSLFVQLWAGEEYLEAYYCCLIIMIPYTIPLAQGIGNSILQASNKLGFQTIVFVLISIYVIFASWFLGKEYGAIGCSIAISMCIIIGEIVCMNIYYKKMGIDINRFWKYFLSLLLPLTIISVLFYMINSFFNIHSWLYFLAIASLMSAILVIGLYVFSMNNYEKGQLNVVVKRLQKKGCHK